MVMRTLLDFTWIETVTFRNSSSLTAITHCISAETQKKNKNPQINSWNENKYIIVQFFVERNQNGADSQLFVGSIFDSIFCRDTLKRRVSLKQIKMEQIMY